MKQFGSKTLFVTTLLAFTSATLITAQEANVPALVREAQPITPVDLLKGSDSLADLDSLDLEAAQLPPLQQRSLPGLEGEPLNLSVRDVLLATLGQNLSIQIVEKDRAVAGFEVWQQFGIYDPVVSLSAVQTRVDQQTTVLPPGSNKPVVSYTDSTAVDASVAQRTPLGTLIEVFARDSRTSDRNFFNVTGVGQINAAYGSEVGINVTQPLLKNAGPLVNNAQIRITRKQLDQSNDVYRQELINRLADVIRGYWELDFAIRNAEVQQQALESARELERVNGARVEVGTLPRLSLFQAQAQVAQRESLLVAAEEQVMESQDRLFQLMNWQPALRDTEWNRPIFPVDAPTTFFNIDLNDRSLVQLAEESRPDLRSARTGLDIAEINRDVNKRQMLPELDLIGSYSHTGIGDDRSDSYSELDSGDYVNYSVGARLSYPLFNRTARSAYRQSLEQLDQQALRIEAVELQIVRDVRQSTRNIRTALRQAKATTRQVKADIEKLEAEIKRREVGNRTTFDVLDFQDDLAQSRANQARAFADYQISLVDLAQSLGILLDVQGIVVEDQPSPNGWAYNFKTVDQPYNASGVKSLDDMLTIVPVKSSSASPSQQTPAQQSSIPVNDSYSPPADAPAPVAAPDEEQAPPVNNQPTAPNSAKPPVVDITPTN